MKMNSIFIALLMVASSNAFSTSFFEAHDDINHIKAEQAMSEGNFAIAYCLWDPLAKKGDSKAQFNIGWMFHNGYGLAIDDSKALDWWLKAAEQGYTEAFYTLADLYLAGFGVEKDKDIAMGWYIAASELGHELSLETIHALRYRKDKHSQKYFSKLLYEGWFLNLALKGNKESLSIVLSLASKTDKKSRTYFSAILKEHWSLFGNKTRVKVARANVRKGPGTQYKIITSLAQDDELVVLSTQGNWTQVGLFKTGEVAWVFSKLLE